MPAKVITLDKATFAIECHKLESMVNGSDFRPDCIVSIANGGIHIGDHIFINLPHLSTKLQRPGTSKKKQISFLFKILPRRILDTMRILEAWILKHCNNKERAIPPFDIPDLNGFNNILIVDDAVDSGITLISVVNAIKTRYPSSHTRSAVITVTTDNPRIYPDYYIFKSVLIRFPWSMDA